MPRFGDIVEGSCALNIAGLMVESWWGNIERRFSSVLTGAHVVMPNHFHGIVMLGAVAGSDIYAIGQGGHSGPPLQTPVGFPTNWQSNDNFVGAARCGRPASDSDVPYETPPSLSDVIGWFKSFMTHDYGIGVRKYNWPPYRGRLWQRGYNDHVIRTGTDFDRINAYIANNPAQWTTDELYAE
jgi:putative transposase